jgi:hypothetical protein
MTVKLSNIVSDRDLYQTEKELCLLHVFEDFFVKSKNQKVTLNNFKDYLIIHKTPYPTVVETIFQDAKCLGYIVVEGSTVKASDLLHETIVCYEKAIENYHKINNFSVSCFVIDTKFDEIRTYLKKILGEVEMR